MLTGFKWSNKQTSERKASCSYMLLKGGTCYIHRDAENKTRENITLTSTTESSDDFSSSRQDGFQKKSEHRKKDRSKWHKGQH